MSKLETLKGKEIYDEIGYYVEGFEPEEVDDTVESLLSTEYYLKAEADKVIAKLENRIAPEPSDRSLRERLNEVCKKHGVSTIQDLDLAFCESEKRQTKFSIEACKEIARHKYKRCLAMAERCKFRMYYLSTVVDYELSRLIPNPTAVKRYMKKESRMDYWKNRWLEFSEKFKSEIE